MASLSAAAGAYAHHAFATEFDVNRHVTLEGKVTKVELINPHSWIHVEVMQDGKPVTWMIEGGSPNSLSRQGWRATTFKPGDAVTVRINPMKDGTPAGNFVGARFDADGKTIGRW